jgi:hypothetical protein
LKTNKKIYIRTFFKFLAKLVQKISGGWNEKVQKFIKLNVKALKDWHFNEQTFETTYYWGQNTVRSIKK